MKLISNARILQDDEVKKVNITYASQIIEISEAKISGNFESVLDVNGLLLIPGGIDAHVHFNDPGFLHHEDFATGSQAAAAGGITTIIDMPCTSIPPVTSVENLTIKVKAIAPKAYVDYAFWGGISGNNINHKKISQLWENGVVGFKIYTISGMDSFSALDYDQISELFHKKPNVLYAFHAEDSEIIAENLAANQVTAENYAQVRSVEAEYKAVKQILAKTQPHNRVHFVHISSKKAAELILNYKEKLSLTWETCPHYLQFTASDFPELRGRLKTAPPVKYDEDRAFLRRQLVNGKLDFVATDHAGCDFSTEKDVADFAEIYNGIPGTQFMLPYVFSEFYHPEILSTLVKMTSENAAKRYGLYPQKGCLGVGSDADFTILDCRGSFSIDEKSLLCKGKYSPFHGNQFKTAVVYTILRGEVVYEIGRGVSGTAGFGRWIKRND